MGFPSFLSCFAAAVFLAGSLPVTVSGQIGAGLDVQTAGHGEPELIFLSEPTASDGGWDHVVARFEVAYRCHVVAPAVDGSSSAEQAGALIAYVREQSLARPVLIGHGSSGTVALIVALQAPELPGRLVLVDSLPPLATDLGNIRCPTLVLGALAGPPKVNRRTFRKRYRSLPGVRFMFFERARHCLMTDDLNGFTDALRHELTGR